MIRTETDTEACHELWQAFSPGKDAWDDWDLMFAFHDQERHRLNFLVHDNDDARPDGLVPLVHDTALNRYTLMAGSYPDGRVLWIDIEDFAEFFDTFPEPAVFFDLKQSWVDELLKTNPQFEAHFTEQEQRFFLVPAEFGFDFYNHIDTFTREKRQKFLYDLRNIAKREPKLHWSTDNEADLFIELVNRNFGAESDYASEENANEVRRVISELQSSGRLRTLTIEIEGRKQAASLSLLHNNKMVALYSAGNGEYNNLGKLVNVETIQEACRLRVDEISFMTGMKWKSDWKMRSETCRTFRKPPAPWGAGVG
ncbi:MAG: GNAT family N-acetyltransferase [Woeseiaceae bacterium]|nr:GNAT family N-acetyltransferase [Woeseiaceae bacterium]